jgi:hypothetical protein
VACLLDAPSPNAALRKGRSALPAELACISLIGQVAQFPGHREKGASPPTRRAIANDSSHRLFAQSSGDLNSPTYATPHRFRGALQPIGIVPANTTTIVDRMVTGGTAYRYEIRARNGRGWGLAATAVTFAAQ